MSKPGELEAAIMVTYWSVAPGLSDPIDEVGGDLGLGFSFPAFLEEHLLEFNRELGQHNKESPEPQGPLREVLGRLANNQETINHKSRQDHVVGRKMGIKDVPGLVP